MTLFRHLNKTILQQERLLKNESIGVFTNYSTISVTQIVRFTFFSHILRYISVCIILSNYPTVQQFQF